MPEKEQQQNQEPKGSTSCNCACDICYCGPNCRCSESLCRCEASSVINSLGRASSTVSATKGKAGSTTNKGSFCSNSNKIAKNNGRSDNQNNTVGYLDPLASPQPQPTTTTTTINTARFSKIIDIGIQGMTCSMCTRSVEQALIAANGVVSVAVSLATHSAHVEYDPNQTRKDELVDAIECIGYDVVNVDDYDDNNQTSSSSIVEFSITGMTCSMCSQAIERAMQSTEGALSIWVSLATNIARIEYDPSIVSVDHLKETIEDVGYDVINTLITDNSEESDEGGAVVSQDRLERLLQQQQTEVSNRKRAFLYSLTGTIPIFTVTMILPFLSSELKWIHYLHKTITIGHRTFVIEALLLWILCTPIQFGCGYPFYKSSWYGFQQGVLGMDVLVAVGTTASYGYATWATLTGSMEYHFYETSSVLICFILLGKWMQSLAVRRTSKALTQLLELQPKTAIQVVVPPEKERDWDPKQDPFEERTVPLASIRKGDIVKVLKGASVPADGLVQYGEMTVDESMITGESLPVLKTQGSVVLGGTICVESGREAAFVVVTGVGSQTALSQIVSLVQNAQNRQVPIQNLADQISGIFVPAVVTISVVTFMVWYALCQSEVVPESWLNGETPATFSLLFGIACLVSGHAIDSQHDKV